ncbi:MAG: hypothetical protein Q8M78_12395 [Burkholderiaceae bacterium]|nr:hypothetical protein [Burkholderiaceae bacterium]
MPQDRWAQLVSQVLLALSAPSAQVVRLVQPVLPGPRVRTVWREQQALRALLGLLA